jgi:hypothetical protein
MDPYSPVIYQTTLMHGYVVTCHLEQKKREETDRCQRQYKW